MMLLAPLVLAAEVYVNGVRADVLPVMTMSGVTVRFDASGNVWIDAPTYKVSVVDRPAAGGVSAVAAAPLAATPTAPARVPVAPGGPGVGAGAWWLVTEDTGSVGQSVEVYVNEVLVRRVASGEPQVLLDLAPYLRPGANPVRIVARPPSVPPAGSLSVYVGRGASAEGTVRVSTIDLRYSRRAEDGLGGSVKEYTVNVP